jgi:hypothetical protein
MAQEAVPYLRSTEFTFHPIDVNSTSPSCAVFRYAQSALDSNTGPGKRMPNRPPARALILSVIGRIGEEEWTGGQHIAGGFPSAVGGVEPNENQSANITTGGGPPLSSAVIKSRL